MSARELYVLGTASQVPTRHRNHNGYFLRWDDEGILFDPGEGTQRQMTLAGLSASSITRICITHFHGDHCLGLPGVIQRLSLDGAPQVAVHFPLSGQVFFERLRRASIFSGLEKLDVRPIQGSGIIYENESILIEAIALDHDVDCYGYRLKEKDQLRVRPERLKAAGLSGPLVAELLKKGSVQIDGKTVRRHEIAEVRPGQSFALIMDTRLCEGAQNLALGVDMLLCEATFMSTETALAKESGHLTASQAGTLARDAGVLKLVLGHFSQRYENLQPLLAEAQQMHGEVVLAVEPDTSGSSTQHIIQMPARREVRFSGQFEAHVTVEAKDNQAFARQCEELGIKSILIELSEGMEPNQPMTESRHEGDLSVVRAEVDGLAQSLEEAGFPVRRKKIEARYDASGVPELDEQTRGLPPSCYFEYHVAVRLASGEKLFALKECALRHGAHVSRNAHKQDRKHGHEQRFLTLRVARVGRTSAESKYEQLLQDLRGQDFELAGERREFTVYDSNLDLDRGWL
jgi:ribonuclease Z